MYTNTIIKKRINKEIENIDKLKHIYNIDCKHNNEFYNFYKYIKIKHYSMIDHINNKETMYIDIINDYVNIITLIIPNDYPFKPYKVDKFKLSNIEWSKYLVRLWSIIVKLNCKILYYFYIIQYINKPLFLNCSEKNLNCFCCSSSCCSGNWSPSCRISNIINEYIEINYIKNYSKFYKNKMLNSLYDNFLEKFKLPEELFELIVNKIIID
tara:strand:+ start:51 stop:683 length:633 start_codon:yes stop_codon:yes gene_type:complete